LSGCRTQHQLGIRWLLRDNPHSLDIGPKFHSAKIANSWGDPIKKSLQNLSFRYILDLRKLMCTNTCEKCEKEFHCVKN